MDVFELDGGTIRHIRIELCVFGRLGSRYLAFMGEAMSGGRLDPHPGCWNSERRDSYMVPVGTMDVPWGVPEGFVRNQMVTEIKDTSSRECRFDLRASDPRCDGCVKK